MLASIVVCLIAFSASLRGAAAQSAEAPSPDADLQWWEKGASTESPPHLRDEPAHHELVAAGQSLFYSGLGIAAPTVVSAAWLWDAYANSNDDEWGAVDKLLGGVFTSAFAGLGGLTLLTGAALWLAGAMIEEPGSQSVEVTSRGVHLSF